MFVHAPQSDKNALKEVRKILVGRDSVEAKICPLVEADWMPKGWKLTLGGVTTIEAAENLRGTSVFLFREDISTEDNEYLVQDLVGCEVFDRVRGPVGVMDSVEPASIGSDRWWIKTPDGQLVPVPAVRRFIVSVDVVKRQIKIVDFDELV